MNVRSIAAACVFLLAQGAAHACSCVPPSDDLEADIRWAFEHADAVVVAKAVSVERQPQGPDDEIDFEIDITELSAAVSFKGDAPAVLRTKITTVCCVCGFSFTEGETYLLFLNEEEDGFYSTHICTRNMLFEDARAAIDIILTKLL
ncbi:MAG: hypothetical protein ISN26_00925 [Betaproteobacteria bacterium AqS2]|uniref:DUF302 domain-containing protein n=1 Tax=Candidatus Amphirhobacter heronislandensis TaxID=1732024 RepID=A0A930UB35_9GAMM|nr:hypothetical protein [Betaproteobacteria bacterium AqS2]